MVQGRCATNLWSCYSQMNEVPGKIIPSAVSIPIDIKSGQDPGWVECPFSNPVSLPVTDRQNIDDEEGGVEGGVWIGIYAPHGAGIIRIYGHNMKGRKSKSLLRKNLKVVDNYLLTAPPIQFPINEVVDFRPSLYTETAGLSAPPSPNAVGRCKASLEVESIAVSGDPS